MLKSLLFIGSISLLIPNLSSAIDTQSIALTATEQKTLRQGDIILKQQPNPSGKTVGQTFAAVGLIKARLHDIYQVLIDFEQYPQFMPNMDTITTVERAERHIVTDIKLSLPLGKYKKYRLQMDFNETPQQATLTWKQLPRPELKPIETIVDTEGYWLLVPDTQTPDHTLVTYYAYTDPGHIPFGLGWIAELMTKSSLPDVVRKTGERVRSRPHSSPR